MAHECGDEVATGLVVVCRDLCAQLHLVFSIL